MTRNKLSDLNNHLFEQLERLNDEELDQSALEEEIKRSKAITTVAQQIINNANLILDANKFVAVMNGKVEKMPELLE